MLHLVWALFTRARARLHKTTATKLVKTLNNTVDNSDESQTYEGRELMKIHNYGPNGKAGTMHAT